MSVRVGFSRMLLLIGIWLSGVATCQAALFNITYDNIGDGVIGTNAIVGNGIFSFSGPATIGNFALSSLPSLSFSASFGLASFTTADIISGLSTTGVSIFDRGAGEFGLVFTGSTGGSLDLLSGPDALSHEPTLGGLGSPVGCCGGNGETNLYFFRRGADIFYFGDYSATTASPVPAPASLALLVLGLLVLARVNRRALS